MAGLPLGIAISLSFHQYSYHGNYMVYGTLRHWLAVIANRNNAFSIRHEGTHHKKFVQSSRMS